MFKNKKGFSLIELTAVVATILIIAGIAIPQYRSASLKTKIVTGMGFMQVLQDDFLNYWNLTNSRPTNLKQLSINTDEFTNFQFGDKAADHIPTGCSFLLLGSEDNPAIRMGCKDFSLLYTIKFIHGMPERGTRRLGHGADNEALINKIAPQLGFTHDAGGWVLD